MLTTTSQINIFAESSVLDAYVCDNQILTWLSWNHEVPKEVEKLTANPSFNKSLLRRSGCYMVRKDNVSLLWKKVVITIPSNYFEYSGSVNKGH